MRFGITVRAKYPTKKLGKGKVYLLPSFRGFSSQMVESITMGPTGGNTSWGKSSEEESFLIHGKVRKQVWGVEVTAHRAHGRCTFPVHILSDATPHLVPHLPTGTTQSIPTVIG